MKDLFSVIVGLPQVHYNGLTCKLVEFSKVVEMEYQNRVAAGAP